MLDCKPIDTPSEQNHKLGIYPDQVPTDKERYQRLVGKLIYLAHTRPDIAYAVNIVSQFMHSPSVDHMGAVTRILRYLKVTPGKGLIFSKYGHTNVEGYTDADWAGSATDRRSTSGWTTEDGRTYTNTLQTHEPRADWQVEKFGDLSKGSGHGREALSIVKLGPNIKYLNPKGAKVNRGGLVTLLH
ncbi:uncharacterized protein LOC110764292 [Prunus avium]|uniref:Uncharacterized protein LOC110764292 n=1 Tax=Prunus avium TaxID=42229 RepID=A0A6P5T6W8_PRUAV|nr:uncharacterized protein LOC110764292 [Prunus avium]